jgi:Obg family GTPase CgtA-like protein
MNEGDEPSDIDFPVSAVTNDGLDRLVQELATLVDHARRDEAAAAVEAVVIHRPINDEVAVTKLPGGQWLVEGRAALRAVRFQDLTNDEALAEIVSRLKALGVDRLLTRAGVRDGDLVSVGALAFEWWRDQVGAGLDRGDHHPRDPPRALGPFGSTGRRGRGRIAPCPPERSSSRSGPPRSPEPTELLARPSSSKWRETSPP